MEIVASFYAALKDFDEAREKFLQKHYKAKNLYPRTII